MQIAAKNSLFIESSSFKVGSELIKPSGLPGLYQQLAPALIHALHKKQLLLGLGERLERIGQQARAYRRMDILEWAGTTLVSLPVGPAYKKIGMYFEALCIHQRGQGELRRAAEMFNLVAAEGASHYRLEAKLSLGAGAFRAGDFKLADSLYSDALHFAAAERLHDPLAAVQVPRMSAVIRALKGDHKGALKILEALMPIAHSMRMIRPHLYYDYLNGYAVELGESGRIEEALAIMKEVLAAPYARAFPEWCETYNDLLIKGDRRPSVFIPQLPSKQMQLAAEAARAEPVVDLKSYRSVTEPPSPDIPPGEKKNSEKKSKLLPFDRDKSKGGREKGKRWRLIIQADDMWTGKSDLIYSEPASEKQIDFMHECVDKMVEMDDE